MNTHPQRAPVIPIVSMVLLGSVAVAIGCSASAAPASPGSPGAGGGVNTSSGGLPASGGGTGTAGSPSGAGGVLGSAGRPLGTAGGTGVAGSPLAAGGGTSVAGSPLGTVGGTSAAGRQAGGATSGGRSGTGAQGGATFKMPTLNTTEYKPPFDPATVAGIQPLFDGETLTGWDCKPNAWSVTKNSISGNAASAGTFCGSKLDYAELRLFVSIMQVSGNGGHSGIGFGGLRPQPGQYANGAWKFLDLMTPSCFFWDYNSNSGVGNCGPNGTDMTRAPYSIPWQGKWFQVELLISLGQGRIRGAMNGVDYLTFAFGTHNGVKTGPIGLQSHAGNQEVRYKDIWIEVNPQQPDTLYSAAKKL